jgi:D-alanine-D-alanine ligase
MPPLNSYYPTIPYNQLKVWVLAPSIETDDSNIDYYYDFSQSIAEYTRAFEELGIEWKWQPVTIKNFKTIIGVIAKEKLKGAKTPLVFNLCDGDEVNGAPGVSVIKLLAEKDILYTGADEYFYEITTSKILMKQAFDKAAVPTPDWEAITEESQNLQTVIEKLGSPTIVKPAVSGGSMGVGIKNVVNDETELSTQVKRMFEGYRGWNLSNGGMVAEKFINGPEFTTLIVGSSANPDHSIIYPSVERVFHPSLPETEQFLSFDRLWEIYEEETAMPDNGNFYEYKKPNRFIQKKIMKISWDAYCSVGGTGYTRIDLRMDKETNKIYVLEVNAQCGLSEDEDYTSIGAILRFAGKPFSRLVAEIINDAFQKQSYKLIAANNKRP